MIELLPRIFAYKLAYYTGFPKILPVSYTISLTYSVTQDVALVMFIKRNLNI